MQFNSHGDSGVPHFVFDPSRRRGHPGPTAGFGFASFLLGDVNRSLRQRTHNTYGRRKSVSLYAQDDIKLTPKFTLNLDLRWDLNGRYHEKYGHWSDFDPTAINPVTGQPGALEFAKDGSDSFEKKEYYHNFSGRIGGAYRLTSRLVARASFGVFYVPLNLNTYSGIPYGFNPGFVPNNQVLAPFHWDAETYPGRAVNIGENPNFTEYGMVSIDPRMLELGNVQEWTAGMEYEVTQNLVFDATAIQNHGYHLESGYDAANQPAFSLHRAGSGPGINTGVGTWLYRLGLEAVAPFPNAGRHLRAALLCGVSAGEFRLPVASACDKAASRARPVPVGKLQPVLVTRRHRHQLRRLVLHGAAAGRLQSAAGAAYDLGLR